MRFAASAFVTLATAFAAAGAAHAAPIIYVEGFDTAKPGNYGVGSTVGSFKVDSGDLDIIGDQNGDFYLCPNGAGNNCVDTSGNTPATLSTMVDLTAGKGYRVLFDLAGNGPRTSGLYTLGASLGDAPMREFTVSELWPFASMQFDYLATVTGPTKLTFQSRNTDGPGYWGPILDSVRIESLSAGAVPEPATWAMIIGFGGIGASLRRRTAVRAGLRFA